MNIVIAAILVLLALLVRYARMYFLIAGYNTMSAKERSLIDIKGIAKLFFVVCVYMAATMVAGYLLALWLEIVFLEIFSLLLALATGLPYLLIKSNSNRYRK